MSVDPSKARGSAQHRDITYYFCSPGCMHQFFSDPAKFVTADSQLPALDAANSSAQPVRGSKVHKDPVCGMTVDPFKAAASIEHGGRLFHFCCKGCAEKFNADPAKFLSPAYKPGGMSAPVQIGGIQIQASQTREHSPAVSEMEKSQVRAKAATYICPMDPEVRQSGPGACPKCGMALEPEMPLTCRSYPVDLPNASRDRARRSRFVSHLRNGAGADDRHCGRGRKS